MTGHRDRYALVVGGILLGLLVAVVTFNSTRWIGTTFPDSS